MLANMIYSTGNYYEATSNALSYMQSSENVVVTEYNNYYLFSGQRNRKAFIFYQGAKVDEKAYAELMHKLAQYGMDCFLVKMPLRLALNNINMADDIINSFKRNYHSWYIGGHSLGGAVAAMYASNNASDIKGLVLLASYSIFKLPESLKVVSILGSNDKILKWDFYRYYLSNLPKRYTEVTIDGGNHSHFGDY
eukprot:jgi/Orpsp1_1/1176921/evm.model.c7180000059503.1